MPVVQRPKTWTATELEDLVLELLGDLKGVDADELRRQLESSNPIMPVDSFDLLDILAAFRQRTGITIPKRKLRRQTMRSVKAFAQFVAERGQP